MPQVNEISWLFIFFNFFLIFLSLLSFFFFFFFFFLSKNLFCSGFILLKI